LLKSKVKAPDVIYKKRERTKSFVNDVRRRRRRRRRSSEPSISSIKGKGIPSK
jgi:hypothetical protein